MYSTIVRRFAACVLCLISVNSVMGEDRKSSDEDFLGGPTSLGSQLQFDSKSPEEAFSHRWQSFKKKVRDQVGLDFNFDYATLYQSAVGM